MTDVPNLQENVPQPFIIITRLPRPSNITTSTINSGLYPEGRQNVSKCSDNGGWSQQQRCSSGPLGSWLGLVELLITIDFSTFGNASQIPFQVGVYPAVSNLTTISDMKPVYLASGSHLYAISSVSFKEKSLSQGLAVLGIPTVGQGHSQ